MENHLHLSSLFFYYLLVPLLWLLLTGCKSVSTGTGTISGSGSDTSQQHHHLNANNNNNNNNNGNHNGSTTTLNKLLLKKLSTNSEFDSILEELLFPGESNSMANCDHHNAINLTGRYGFVKSPQFPSGYRVPLFCRWNIVATRPNEIITISFEEIDIEIPNESQADCRRTSKPKYCCDRNYLSISAKDSVEEQLYCGVTAPSRQVFISSSSRVSIAFNATTNRKDSRGFYFTYSIAPRSSMDCASNEFHCNNGKCIPPKWLCNNRDECGDSSDETVCNSSQDNLQKCNNDESEFYHSSKRCDSRFDCRNRADELGCFGCPANKFMCRSTQTCIEASSVCNGIADCEDFDDELNCGLCPPGKVRCGSMSACYDPFRQRCNRVLDCPNGIDEVNCFDECRGRISCGNASGCYEMDERCNGIVQCADFSDEKNCSLELCRPDKGSFLCSNGRCIPSLWTCDRSADCFDGSDEMRCLKNSVITAAIIGSLICGLLIVIAVSCACKLVALRKMEQYRRSLNSSAFPGGGGAGGGAGGAGLSLHSAEFPFSSNPGDMDASLFRLDHSVFFREPPPSYATTMGGYQDVNGAHNSSTNSYMEQYRRYRRQRRCRRMMRRQHRQNQNTLQLSNNNNNNNNSGSEAEGSSLQACLSPDSQDYHHSHSTNPNPGTIQPPCNRSPLSSVQPTTAAPPTATSTSSPAVFSGQVTLPNQYNSSPFTSHRNNNNNNNSSSHSYSNSHQTHQNSKFTNLGSPVAGCSSTDTTSTTTTNSSDSIVQPPPPPPLTKPNSSSIPNLSINGGSSSSVRSAPSPLQSTYHQLQHLHYLPNPNKLQQPSQAQQTHQQHNGVDSNRRHLTIELEPIPALTNFDCDSQPLIR